MNNQNENLLSALTRSGVLINVSVRYWRGQKKLKPEDIGLSSNDVSDRLISLGHKRLLPKDATAQLTLIEGRAHALIEANTFPFLNGLGHFLPNQRLSETMEKIRVMESEFWQAKQEFLSKYSTLRSNASREWRAMAQKLVPDPERMVATIEAAFPHARNMDKFFGFDIQLFQVTLPDRLSTDLITEMEQQEVIQAREQAAREAGEKIRRDTENFIADCVATMRQQTAQLCNDMLNSINNSETGVHQKTLNRLIRFIDQFKQMNFANDAAMEQQLDQVRKELLTRSAEEYRDSSYARDQLLNGLKALGDRASQLAKQDASNLVQRFGEVGRRKFNLAA